MNDDNWKTVNELHAEEHSLYMEMKKAASRGSGVSQKQLNEMKERWQTAHKTWWEEVGLALEREGRAICPE